MFSGVALGNRTESLLNCPCVARRKRRNTNTAKEPKNPDVDWRMEKRTVRCFLSGNGGGVHRRMCVRCRRSCATGAIASARATMDKGPRAIREMSRALLQRRMCREPKATLLERCSKPEGKDRRGREEKKKKETNWIRRIYIYIGEEWKRSKREQSEARSSKFALNSQIIENAVPVSAHNAYRSRASLSDQLLSGSLLRCRI